MFPDINTFPLLIMLCGALIAVVIFLALLRMMSAMFSRFTHPYGMPMGYPPPMMYPQAGTSSKKIIYVDAPRKSAPIFRLLFFVVLGILVFIVLREMTDYKYGDLDRERQRSEMVDRYGDNYARYYAPEPEPAPRVPEVEPEPSASSARPPVYAAGLTTAAHKVTPPVRSEANEPSYHIQVGAYRAAHRAERLFVALLERGHRAEIDNDGELYRVRIPGFESPGVARAYMSDYGLDGIVKPSHK